MIASRDNVEKMLKEVTKADPINHHSNDNEIKPEETYPLINDKTSEVVEEVQENEIQTTPIIPDQTTSTIEINQPINETTEEASN
jgi:hypothetical protein